MLETAVVPEVRISACFRVERDHFGLRAIQTMAGDYVIVGGSNGIGLEITRRLVTAGQAVTVLSRSNESLAAFPSVSHVHWDATSDEIASEQLPNSIAGLVYCPGSINLRPFSSLKPDMFRADFELNVMGAIKSIQASLPGLKAEGASSILLFSTVAVQQGMPAHASIAVSKGAIEGLTRTLATELSPGIRVNCLAPALTETKMTERFFRDAERAKALGEKYPMARTGTPSDLAAMACLLLSAEAGWITGQVIGVDGGMSTIRKM